MAAIMDNYNASGEAARAVCPTLQADMPDKIPRT